MEFNCGPSRGERLAARRNWHGWFAWYPVRIGCGVCVWLEWVDRRRITIDVPFGPYPPLKKDVWRYRPRYGIQYLPSGKSL